MPLSFSFPSIMPRSCLAANKSVSNSWRNGDYERDIVDQLADETFPKIAEWVEKTGSKCTLENAVQRKEW